MSTGNLRETSARVERSGPTHGPGLDQRLLRSRRVQLGVVLGLALALTIPAWLARGGEAGDLASRELAAVAKAAVVGVMALAVLLSRELDSIKDAWIFASNGASAGFSFARSTWTRRGAQEPS